MLSHSHSIIITRLIAVLILLQPFAAQPQNKEESAGELRRLGDAAVSAGKFKEAISYYTRLIDKEPTPSNIFKRAQVHLRQRKYADLISDLSKILSMDKNHKNALSQRAKIYKMRGECELAKVDFEALSRLDPNHATAQTEIPALNNCITFINQANHAYSRGDWHSARDAYGRALDIATESTSLMMQRARCQEKLSAWPDLISDTRHILQNDDSNVEALGLRAHAYYMMGELEHALTHFKAGLRYDPENTKLKPAFKRLKQFQTKLAAGDSSMEENNAKEAIEYYSDALELERNHHLLSVDVQLRLCRAYVKGKQGKEAVAACSVVLEHDDNSMDAWKLRAEAHQINEDYQEAINDLQKAAEKNPQDGDIQQRLRDAQMELKKSQRKDHYKNLGVKRDASSAEIKKAFRNLALKWHPDKCPKEDHDKCEKTFRDIGEAYEILSNDESRQKYDSGEDIQPEPGFNPHQHFQQFHFGGGQHFTFTFG